MKGIFVCLIMIILFGGIASAQNVTAYWTLTWNGNCSNTIGPVEGTAITRVSPAPVPLISITSNGAGSNGWNVSAINAGRYYQYTLTSSANVVINSFSLTAKVSQANMHGAIGYSLDGFSTYTTLLANYTFANVNPHTYSNNAIAIHIANGQTLTIRVYAWNANTAAKMFYNKDLIMYGNTESLTTDFYRTKATGNWSDISTWESSADGTNWYDATLIPTVAANNVTINHAVTLTSNAACGNLTFNGGSIDHGNYNLNINGSLSGIPYLIYSGTGVASQAGNNAFITVTTANPTSLPAIMNTLTTSPGEGISMLLPNDVSTNNLHFNNGSITLGNHQMIVTGNLTGPSSFYYNGTGGLSGTGALHVNTILGVNASDTIPPEVNSIEVNAGIGNIAELPNNVVTTNLTFTSGALAFNGHELTLANKDFTITGSQTITNLAVILSNVSHTYDGCIGIAHTWQTTGSALGTVDITFSYPIDCTDASHVRVYNRNHVDGESIWTWVGLFNTINHGSYCSVTVPGISSLNERGDLDWTISEADETLPVELSSFTSTLTIDGNITLNWITHSETDVLGYHIFRNTENVLSTANCLTQALIPATNTSYTNNYSFTDHEIGLDHVIYYYWLQYTEFSGNTVVNGPITMEVNANNSTPGIVPENTCIQTIYPNPFRDTATINYGLVKDEKVTVEVYNIKGQLVNKLVSGFKDAGNFAVSWNGHDKNGSKCGSGVYYVVMNTGTIRNIHKIVKF